ncbi:MAG: DNA mismatch repair endonuclease MutL [Alphaproteobacteria bacterium]|nr:DNA mismatch repair endonuclease MutL [Alphaproteobacteria bacterium]
MRIRHLPDHLVNQIAAGEVIERPAAAVKELIENSIDAGATQIDIDIRDGGKSLIVIRDNGFGMSAEEIETAIERHATSKLPTNDLVHINFLGFRGEALPSIGSISRLNIKSKTADQDDAWEISMVGGKKGKLLPTAHSKGTTIEVRDLFYATPARLKFLKTERSEYNAVKDTVQRTAMAFPKIGFKLIHEGSIKLNLSAEQGDFLDQRRERLSAILGKDFGENALPILIERDGIKVSGYSSLPTLNRATNQYQYLFVNGRPVKDRMLLGCVRAAYMDVLHSGRHPLCALFIEISPEMVDVNVHPAKAEVRFRDAGHIRGLIITALKQALLQGGQTTSSTLSQQTIERMQPQNTSYNTLPYKRGNSPAVPGNYIRSNPYNNLAEKVQNSYTPYVLNEILPSAKSEPVIEQNDESQSYPLGAARAQIHENYIISQSENGLVIIDQHAAHERIVYEKLKNQIENEGVKSQGLLIPEIIDMDETKISTLIEHQETLSSFGLQIEPFGNDSLSVQSVPALLGNKTDIKKLIFDILDELIEHETTEKLKKSIHEVLSSTACHGSVRSGRRLNIDEMNNLLRQMEEIENSGHCNHGRPTFIKLDLKDIEKLFGRR